METRQSWVKAQIKGFRRRSRRQLCKHSPSHQYPSIREVFKVYANRSFKAGDLVFYGATRGIIIGIYNATKALFFSHEQRDGFQTRDEVSYAKPGASRIIDYLIKEHFGYTTHPSQMVLNQHRFKILSLEELKHMSVSQIDDDRHRLIRKRHLFIKMAKTYVRTGKSDETIDRLCSHIDMVQAEIELDERKTKLNKTAFATYE